MQHFILHKSGNYSVIPCMYRWGFFQCCDATQDYSCTGTKTYKKSSRKWSSLDFMKTNTHLDT